MNILANKRESLKYIEAFLNKRRLYNDVLKTIKNLQRMNIMTIQYC